MPSFDMSSCLRSVQQQILRFAIMGLFGLLLLTRLPIIASQGAFNDLAVRMLRGLSFSWTQPAFDGTAAPHMFDLTKWQIQATSSAQWRLIGVSGLLQGSVTIAQQAYEACEALQADPFCTLGLADTREALGDREGAWQLRARVPAWYIYLQRAMWRLSQGDIGQAERYISLLGEQGLAQLAGYEVGNVSRQIAQMADNYRNRGNTAQVQAIYQLAILVGPDNDLARLQLAALLRQQGLEDEARDHLLIAAQSSSSVLSALAWENLGVMALARQNYSQAITYLEQAHFVEPNSARHQVQLARGYLAAGDPDAARPLLQRAALLDTGVWGQIAQRELSKIDGH